MFDVLHEAGTSGSEVAMGLVGCGGLESRGRDQGRLQTLSSPMLSDPVRDRAYGTAAANDDASRLEGCRAQRLSWNERAAATRLSVSQSSSFYYIECWGRSRCSI